VGCRPSCRHVSHSPHAHALYSDVCIAAAFIASLFVHATLSCIKSPNVHTAGAAASGPLYTVHNSKLPSSQSNGNHDNFLHVHSCSCIQQSCSCMPSRTSANQPAQAMLAVNHCRLGAGLRMWSRMLLRCSWGASASSPCSCSCSAQGSYCCTLCQ